MTDGHDPLVAKRATHNPYLTAGGLVLRRLAWDVRPESWLSRAKVRRWRDRHDGEKAVILCNGPSLLNVDLSSLKDTFTFGLNKINLLFDKSNFRPSCVVSVNSLVLEQNAEFFNATDIPLFLDSGATRWVESRKTVCFLHSTGQSGFARDCSWSVIQGHTVTFVAMQLAFHMGFTNVALVGCDHSFSASGPANRAVASGEVDHDHFDPNYFAGGMKWQLPDLFESEVAFTRAKDMYEAFDRKIVNATVGGKLEIFEQEDLAQFLSR